MKHELDDDTTLINPDGTPYTEDQRYGFFVGLAHHYATQYQRDRQYEYPKIADQLDMLWHAMDSGEIPKAMEFYTAIKAVKAKYPSQS